MSLPRPWAGCALAEHGGADAGPPVAFDFSTNACPLEPPQPVRRALQQADRRRYPDPGYTALRAQLGAWLGVASERVLPTAGGSEAIRRLTLAARLRGVARVWVPQPGYGDYRAAAEALGLEVRAYGDGGALLRALAACGGEPSLVWLCEPCNPTGESLPAAFWQALAALPGRGTLLALDRAYEPLRLEGRDPVPPALADRAWQLWSPNKALGLTGVRAGWAVAPARDDALPAPRLEALAPSWVLSAEGVALLQAWTLPATQHGVHATCSRLRAWKRQQRAALRALGWEQRPSVTPFWLARPCEGGLARRLVALRAQGVKLRDATSFGLPGWVRLSVQPPPAQQALLDAWQAADAAITSVENSSASFLPS
ncbi:pyridoxal phosphate-dependent aminotransferase [Azohydromonas aeria]|uniref:pyridoxal phosphate-dependent aminotransferase n=1 Tax=Azohydromonas aeria TaxID=2590212 RepID=UPI0012FA6D9E|nr:aminotransferase class I/II-fold pyridoxal phosphate-dependent enzyme [Azohydromonas aeria]